MKMTELEYLNSKLAEISEKINTGQEVDNEEITRYLDDRFQYSRDAGVERPIEDMLLVTYLEMKLIKQILGKSSPHAEALRTILVLENYARKTTVYDFHWRMIATTLFDIQTTERGKTDYERESK